ncbi:MAG: hypothetical protein IKS19_07155 [Clostridia bacterium]|nr:hypothetical protein [Clostridia bacterium]
MKFEERYKEQTQKLHADKNDLQEIIKKYRQQENVVDFSEVSAMNKNRNKILRRITAAAAALALVAVSAAIAFKSGGFIKPASISSYPSEQVNTISAGDRDIDSLIKTSQVNVSDNYEELFAKIYELQSVNRYAKAAGAILDEPVEYGADGFAAAEESAMVDLLAAGSDSQSSTAAAPADPNYVTDIVALKRRLPPPTAKQTTTARPTRR